MKWHRIKLISLEFSIYFLYFPFVLKKAVDATFLQPLLTELASGRPTSFSEMTRNPQPGKELPSGMEKQDALGFLICRACF